MQQTKIPRRQSAHRHMEGLQQPAQESRVTMQSIGIGVSHRIVVLQHVVFAYLDRQPWGSHCHAPASEQETGCQRARGRMCGCVFVAKNCCEAETVMRPGLAASTAMNTGSMARPRR
eukprot:1857754-Pleurochrysis_carterae.AAC.1